LAVALSLGVGGLLAASPASASASAALAPECVPATFTVTCRYLSDGYFDIPSGVSSLHMIAVGGSGAAGAPDAPGGHGSKVEGDVSNFFRSSVGNRVQVGGIAVGSSGGVHGGGDGNCGGGGGGASAIIRSGFFFDNDAYYLIAAGGGGGGCDGSADGDTLSGGGTGGDAGKPGASGMEGRVPASGGGGQGRDCPNSDNGDAGVGAGGTGGSVGGGGGGAGFSGGVGGGGGRLNGPGANGGGTFGAGGGGGGGCDFLLNTAAWHWSLGFGPPQVVISWDTALGQLRDAGAAGQSMNGGVTGQVNDPQLLTGSVNVPFRSNLPGIASDWIVEARGKRALLAAKSNPLVLAKGTATVTTPGQATIAIRLTKLGRRLIAAARRAHHTIHPTNMATFTPLRGKAVTRTARLKLQP
jgi:hypothetical protein